MKAILIRDSFDFEPVDEKSVHIYRLYNQSGRCIYVGQTVQLKRRIYEHLASGKVFSRVEETKCPKNQGNTEEAREIVKLKPTMNKSLPKSNDFVTTAQVKRFISSLFDKTPNLANVVFQNGSCKYIRSSRAQQIIENVSSVLEATALLTEGGDDE